MPEMDDELFSVDPADQVDEFGDPVEPETTPEPEPEHTPEPEPEVAPETDPEPEPEPTPEPEPEQPKPVQTPEENARFAEQRRQRQLEERAQQLAQQMLQQSPEYQLAQFLQQQANGAPTQQILDYYQKQALERQAQEQNIPVEILQRIQAAEQAQMTLQQQLQQQQFNAWYAQQEVAKAEVLREYPMLTADDVEASLSYMLNEIGSTNIPLRQAVFAQHGTKIIEAQREAARQEALAELSGRKPSPLPPQSGKVDNNAVVLTDDEIHMANALGIDPKEYAKYKD